MREVYLEVNLGAVFQIRQAVFRQLLCNQISIQIIQLNLNNEWPLLNSGLKEIDKKL